MTPIRTLAVLPLSVALAGCGFVEADPHRFERWAQDVAAIPVNAEEAGLRGAVRTAADLGLRPAVEVSGSRTAPRTPMRIEVVEPHVLWEARAEGGPADPIEAAAGAAAQIVVEQAVQRAPEVVQDMLRQAGLTVQLGAFSSRQAAETAWARLSGQAPFSGAVPRYETVRSGGRSLVRLRAGPVSPERVAAVCRAAGAGDFCTSTAQS